MREAVIATSTDFAESYMYCPMRHCECKGDSCMLWHPMVDDKTRTTMDIGMCGLCNYQLKDMVIRDTQLDGPDETKLDDEGETE